MALFATNSKWKRALVIVKMGVGKAQLKHSIGLFRASRALRRSPQTLGLVVLAEEVEAVSPIFEESNGL